jgi:hypothetical protein
MAADLGFPWFSDNCTEQHADSFRVNVKTFLSKYGKLVELPEFPGIKAWVIKLTSSSATARLHVYEERVVGDEPMVCDQCRIIGNPFCKCSRGDLSPLAVPELGS